MNAIYISLTLHCLHYNNRNSQFTEENRESHQNSVMFHNSAHLKIEKIRMEMYKKTSCFPLDTSLLKWTFSNEL